MIRVENLIKKYGTTIAVNEVSLQVGEGEVFAFLGPNGAGKTTTTRILTTMLRPTSGIVCIDGLDISRHRQEARKKSGVIFQEATLDDLLTAKENLELHCSLYGVRRGQRADRVKEMLTIFELWDRRNERVKQFSGGMRRRLEVARALLHRPKILFMDEPTTGLDPQTRSNFWSQIQMINRNEGTTVFMTTHYLEEAERVAHRIAIIDHGMIVDSGSVADLNLRTNSTTLEEAFICITGSEMRA